MIGGTGHIVFFSSVAILYASSPGKLRLKIQTTLELLTSISNNGFLCGRGGPRIYSYSLGADEEEGNCRMLKLRLICVLLMFMKITDQQLFSQRLPKVSDIFQCGFCQTLPGLTSGPLNFFRSLRVGVRFRLYPGSSPGHEGVEILTGDSVALYESGFNPQLPLTVLTHGWTQDIGPASWVQPMRQALQNKENMNVLLVDWSNFSRNSYGTAAFTAKYVGRLLAKFLEFIKISYPGFSGQKVHLIGFSMGAHVSGVAGQLFPGIARITGLDPAGPDFECYPRSERLDRSDAHFVDIVHTNSGCATQGHIGYRIPLGHQDFYVNGGRQQPGCPPTIPEFVLSTMTSGSPKACHHERAPDYFRQTINSDDRMYGVYCTDDNTFKTGACRNNLQGLFGYHASPDGMPRTDNSLTFYLYTQ